MAPYSREVTVAAIYDFYKYLSSMGAIPESAILIPPALGWSDINSTILSGLGKNEDVIDILRHLPYISKGFDGNRKISYKTNPIQYNDKSDIRWVLDRNKLEGLLTPVGAGDIPSHVAVLTEGSRYGSWLLLDTHEGTVTDYIMFERPEREDPPKDSPDYWRAYKTLPVADFFKDWKEKFRSLEWVALPHNVDDGMLLEQNSSSTDEIRDIYRAYGWPDNFRREECKQALFKWEKIKWSQ